MSEPMPPAARLLSLIAHELKSPTNVLVGSISLLKQDKHGPLTDYQQRLVDQAAKAGARITELLAALSDVARLDAQAVRLVPTALDLHQLTLDIVAAWSCPEGLDVRLVVDASSTAATVRADPERLARAGRALVDAHVRALPDGWVRMAAATLDDGGRAWGVLTLIPEASSETAPVRITGGAEEFDEFRGGLGFELPAARRVIDALGGRLVALPLSTGRSATRVLLPLQA